MPTISITVSDELYERLAGAVKDSKRSAEDFILLSVSEKLERLNPEVAEVHVDPATAASYAEYLRSGESISATDALQYFEGRITGKDVPQPVFKKTNQ
jgi:predicted CopG family antitoxin